MAGTVTYLIDSSGQTWAIAINTDGSLSTTPVASGGGGGGGGTSTTNPLSTIQAGSFVDAVIQDCQISTTNRVAVLDYIDRIHKRILRESQWKFLHSQPQKFITQPGVTKYWIANGTPIADATNTELNLDDVWSIDPHSVYDRSNNNPLAPDAKSALYSSPSLNSPDAKPRYAKPRSYGYDVMNPGVLNIFPAPDNQCSYQPVPLAPVCVLTAAGTLPARTYYVQVTFVDSEGNESTPSTHPTIVYVPANYLLNVQPPDAEVASAAMVNYSQFNVYVGTTATNATLQNSAPLNALFTEPTSGLVTGRTAPKTNSLIPLYGYIIEFCYYVQRQNIVSETQVLQIPDIYRDVVIAGANYYVNLYINKDPELNKSGLWKADFVDGLRQIRKDLYINYRNTDFLTPDQQSQMSYTNGITVTGFGEI